jgi:hypothetical protein
MNKSRKGLARLKFQENFDGFSAVEALLILVIVGILCGTGWYVYSSNKKTDDLLSSADNTKILSPSKAKEKATTTTPKQADETVNWTKVTSGKNSFSVKIPDGWNLQNWTSRDYLFAASYKDLTHTSGKAAMVANGDTAPTDSGPVKRFNITGNPIAQKSSIGNYFNEVPQDFGPVSGVTGKKYVHTYSEDVDGVKKGDKAYLYRFEGSKTLITADYYVLGGEADQSALVEKTLKTLSFE